MRPWYVLRCLSGDQIRALFAGGVAGNRPLEVPNQLLRVIGLDSVRSPLEGGIPVVRRGRLCVDEFEDSPFCINRYEIESEVRPDRCDDPRLSFAKICSRECPGLGAGIRLQEILRS